MPELSEAANWSKIPDHLSEADPAVVQEAGEARPMLGGQQVVDRFGDLDVLRQFRAFAAQPAFQVFDQGCGKALPRLAPGGWVEAIQTSLDLEQRVDALHRLEGEGRIHGQACAAQGTTPQTGEIGLHRGLVYENHAFRPIRDGWQAMLEPVGSPLSYPGTAAFGGHQRLFL